MVKLNCQQRGLDILREQNIIIVTCQKDITFVQDNRKVFSLPIKYEVSSISINTDTLYVAVGGDAKKVHIYTLDGTTLNAKT